MLGETVKFILMVFELFRNDRRTNWRDETLNHFSQLPCKNLRRKQINQDSYSYAYSEKS